MKLNLEIDSQKAIPWIIVAVLCGLLIWSLCVDSGEPTVVTERTTDTLVVTKTDTVTVTKVKTIERKVVDTTYIVHRDSIYVPVPISEYHFKKNNLFDFRVRGFDVELLEANVYPKTVYETITNENTTTITKYKSSLFVLGGLDRICGAFAPNMGLSLSFKGKLLIGAKIGLLEDKPYWGFNIGYNVLQK